MSTLSDRLAEAEEAYSNLVMGKAPRVIVDQNGEKVEFVTANSQRLYLYIQSLRSQLSPSCTPSNGPAGFLF